MFVLTEIEMNIIIGFLSHHDIKQSIDIQQLEY